MCGAAVLGLGVSGWLGAATGGVCAACGEQRGRRGGRGAPGRSAVVVGRVWRAGGPAGSAVFAVRAAAAGGWADAGVAVRAGLQELLDDRRAARGGDAEQAAASAVAG